MSVPVSWVLGLMTALEPTAPWRDSYEATAIAIAKASEAEPLFGAESEERTAALLVAIAWYESRLKPDAKSADGQFMCLFQVDKRYFEAPETPLTDQAVCTQRAVSIIKKSLAKCSASPQDERLAAFASGTCDKGVAASRYRTFLGGKLLREHPVVHPRVEAQGTPPKTSGVARRGAS